MVHHFSIDTSSKLWTMYGVCIEYLRRKSGISCKEKTLSCFLCSSYITLMLLLFELGFTWDLHRPYNEGTIGIL